MTTGLWSDGRMRARSNHDAQQREISAVFEREWERLRLDNAAMREMLTRLRAEEARRSAAKGAAIGA